MKKKLSSHHVRSYYSIKNLRRKGIKDADILKSVLAQAKDKNMLDDEKKQMTEKYFLDEVFPLTKKDIENYYKELYKEMISGKYVKGTLDFFLESSGVDDTFPKMQIEEMSKAYYAGFLSAILIMRDDIAELPEDDAFEALDAFITECEKFFNRC